ncbi:MAG: hypothetical protein JSU86_00850 [Phycisphaerales bacterium]|nr:MAG: hypothetical protein JSU86_00850 [Phycisphaerales bacterium]
MAKKPDRIQPVALHAEEDPQGRIQVMLPERMRKNQTLMLWLHHRVVDLLADKGLLDFLAHDVEERLALLSTDITSDYVADLLHEAEDAVKQPEDEAEQIVQREEAARA